MTLPEMQTLCESLGHKKFRGKQLHDYIRKRGVLDVNKMSILPSSLRSSLASSTIPTTLSLLSPGAGELQSKDGTIKRSYSLETGHLIESVLMPYKNHWTACISSQVGCAQGCVFCATGQQGFSRQMGPGEILEQVALFDVLLKSKGHVNGVGNVVFMGMGEPLSNYKNVKKAVELIREECGIGSRRITISTVGIVDKIRRMADDGLKTGLAVSLHQSSDVARTDLMPANARNGGLSNLLSSVKYYQDVTRRRVTFEWAAIKGENDDKGTARGIGRMMKEHGIRSELCHVNVIPLNPTDGYGGKKSGVGEVEGFCEVLRSEFGISATKRVRRGIDIEAGCGQLKKVIEEMKGEGGRGGLEKVEAVEEVVMEDGNGDEDEDEDGDWEYDSQEAGVDFDFLDFVDEESMVEGLGGEGEIGRLLDVVKGSAGKVGGELGGEGKSSKAPSSKGVKVRSEADTLRRKLKKVKKNLKRIGELESLRSEGGKLKPGQVDKVNTREEVERERIELEGMLEEIEKDK